MSTNINTFAERGLHGNTGERNALAKLDEHKVTDIRLAWLCNATETALAKQFGVSPTTIHRNVSNKSWKHVPWPDVDKERFAYNVLGVRRDGAKGTLVAAFAVHVAMASFAVMDLLAPGSILRALWERRFWAARKRKRELLRALPPLNPAPEPPTPPAAPAAAAVPPFTGRDFTAPRDIRDQAVRVKPGDRAWRDPDVQEIAGSKRFEVLIGGRTQGGQERRA